MNFGLFRFHVKMVVEQNFFLALSYGFQFFYCSVVPLCYAFVWTKTHLTQRREKQLY